MLRIRLQRGGSNHNPVYRIVVAESTSRRDGRHCDILGHYAPKARGHDPEYRLNLELAEAWIKKGAQPSDTIKGLMRRARRDQKAQAEQVQA